VVAVGQLGEHALADLEHAVRHPLLQDRAVRLDRADKQLAEVDDREDVRVRPQQQALEQPEPLLRPGFVRIV
jgi:hypothetical protein